MMSGMNNQSFTSRGPLAPAAAFLAILLMTAAVVIATFSANVSEAATTPAQQSAGWHATCTTASTGVCSITNTTGVNPDSVTLTTRMFVTVYVKTSTATTITVQALKVNTTAAYVGVLNFDVHVDYTPAGPTTPPTTPTTTPPTTAPTTPPTTPPTTGPTGSYPDAGSTGVPAGTTLTAYTGPDTVPAGTTIDSKDISTCLSIGGAGVTIKNSKVHGACGYVIDNYGHSGTPLTIVDSEIYCTGNGGTAIGEENVVTARVNVHGCENGYDINKDFTVQDSYIHDLYQSSEAHSDGAQVSDGGSNIKFLHNRIYAGGNYNGTVVNGTSAIITPRASVGGASNVTIDGNLMAGGAYTLYCVQSGKGTNFVVTNNRFSTIWASKGGVYGPWTDCDDETHSGNAMYESGQPLD
jgi:hypothetical protein